jgi:hypothetical protein
MSLIKIDPNSTDNQIKERIRSMMDKVKRTGTSQDKTEWVTYSNHSTYKGFVCMIARVPKKGYGYRYKGIARPIAETEPIKELETMYTKTIMKAGKELYHYIDLLRDVNKN